MRIFAVSDLHVDYEENGRWLDGLSTYDFTDDVVIVPGDISDSLLRIDRALSALAFRFRQVMFVPGNHELWVSRDKPALDSMEKFARICDVATEAGALMRPLSTPGFTIVPLFSWYDFSFGLPSDELRMIWADFRACRWPEGMREAEVTQHFLGLNEVHIVDHPGRVISFSHFLPRADLLPGFVPAQFRALLPVFGCTALDLQLRRLKPAIHVYGHSHLNRQVKIDGVRYVNNAFGYPRESRITAKELLLISDMAD